MPLAARVSRAGFAPAPFAKLRPVLAKAWLIPLLLFLVLLVVPLAVSVATHAPPSLPWYQASLRSSGLAPDPARVREPVVQVYAARAYGRRGAFAVHTWVIVKREGAGAFTRYDVVGWGGAPVVRENYIGADALWYGSDPELLLDRRGPGVDALIERIEQAVASYPFVHTYRTWPGPNSNTFVAHIGRSVPELRLDLPASAIGKDYLPLASAISRAPSGTGVQVSLLGVLGVLVAPVEGVEIDVLGLSFGVDLASPALRVPGLGRVGLRNVQ
jgi:hypothetical protein